MRRGRRGGQSVLQFGGSGEDSFVAVVVTKLTGALLFILLLAMVIMALLPKGADPVGPDGQPSEPSKLAIQTPSPLPEAIAGRPYQLALAASGGSGTVRWTIVGELPEGLRFDPETGILRGTPQTGSSEPVRLQVRASDGQTSAAKSLDLVIYQPDQPLSMPSQWALVMPRVPWRAWLEAGFGFLVLLLVHLWAMQGVRALEHRAHWNADEVTENRPNIGRRFLIYRLMLRLATISAIAVLAGWLWLHRPEPGSVERSSEANAIAGGSESSSMDSDAP